MTIERIVVGVDGSENSRVAVTWAAGLAAAVGAEVVAVHVQGLLERTDEGDLVPSRSVQETIREKVETTWSAPLDEAGVACRRLVRDGTPVSVLLGLADEVDADLIVVGSRGLGGFPELLLGSTSTQVAQLSPRPVTIVPLPRPDP